MQRFISVIIIGVLFAIMAQPTLKILHFYKNQAEIIAKHCVNKDKPAMHCEGHCYLEKQLTENKTQPESNALPEISIFMPLAALCSFEIELLQPTYASKRKIFYLASEKVKAFHGDIFTPPKSIA
ncbi:MAG: hypothetical protein R3279_04795 [Putridiphycobacter sp.]|nr:hypothetical protein [Putridiphycobacter sp.]